jgi:hypothetical protein
MPAVTDGGTGSGGRSPHLESGGPVGHHGSCCAGRHEQPGRRPRPASSPAPPIPLAGPVSQTIVGYAERVRYRLHEDLVERHARELHARASYDCWNGLSETDQELWRHMARLDLTG